MQTVRLYVGVSKLSTAKVFVSKQIVLCGGSSREAVHTVWSFTLKSVLEEVLSHTVNVCMKQALVLSVAVPNSIPIMV